MKTVFPWKACKIIVFSQKVKMVIIYLIILITFISFNTLTNVDFVWKKSIFFHFSIFILIL